MTLVGTVLTLGAFVPVPAGAVVPFSGAALVAGTGFATTYRGMLCDRADWEETAIL